MSNRCFHILIYYYPTMAKSKEKVIVLGSLCIYVRTFNRSDNNTELILSNERLNNFKKFGVKKSISKIFFYRRACQCYSTLPDEYHEQNPRVAITILIANADSAYHRGLLRSFCFIGPSASRLRTKHDHTNAVVSGGSSVREYHTGRASPFVLLPCLEFFKQSIKNV